MLNIFRSSKNSYQRFNYSILQNKDSNSNNLLLIGGRGQLGAEIEKTYRQSAWTVTVIGKEEMDKFLTDREFEKQFFSGTFVPFLVAHC
jgi:hypothetical protein